MNVDDIALAARLHSLLVAAQPDLRSWDRYYEGKQTLSYLAPELERELEGRVRAVVVNWPRLVVDSLEERLDVEGFRLRGTPEPFLWDMWQSNGLDEGSQQAHTDALACRRAYVIVGAGDSGDMPLITVESATQVYAHHDPRTREVTAAVKAWYDDDGRVQSVLYLPDRTVRLQGPEARDTGWAWMLPQYQADASPPPGDGWDVVSVDEHRLGVVPVVPVVNRGRVLDQMGVSELADIVPLSDAACKVATDMMVSAEYHAIPRRWVVGMTDADFMDQEGRPLSKWDRIAGRVWATGGLPSEVQLGQFPEADLRNFHETLNSLARMVASLSGLPPHFLGYSDANPASADAIRSAETRLVKRAERRQRAFGGAWEQVMRLAATIAGHELPQGERLETVWRDAATPTMAQRADAVVKLRQAGLVSVRQAREDLGYTAEQIARMAEDDDEAASRILGGEYFPPLKPVQGGGPDDAEPDVPAGPAGGR